MIKELKNATQGYYFAKTGKYEWHNAIIEIKGESPFMKIVLIADLGFSNEADISSIVSIVKIKHPDKDGKE